MDTIKAALIGCGNISKYHVDGIRKAGASLLYACDTNYEAAESVARATGAVTVSDYRRALEDDKVDVVHIVVNSSLHKKICIEALEAGKQVICEKTLSESASDSHWIVEIAKKTGRMLFTSYMKRFIPSVVQAKALKDEIGTLLSARFFTRQMWGNLWDGPPTDGFFRVGEQGKSEVVRRYGGGILHCGGSHILDLVCFLLGRPQSVVASQVRPEYLDYDIKTNAILTQGELDIQFEALAHPLAFAGFLGDGWDEGFELMGTKGKLIWKSSLWDDVSSKSSVLIHEKDTGESIEYKYHPVSPFSNAIESFYADIETKVQRSQPIESGYHVDQLIETIIASSISGKREILPW